jgi:prepilin-type processing-associated H-X9-DG protein
MAILTAIIGGAYAGMVAQAKQSSCAFDIRQMSVGLIEYLQDNDDAYPQTKGHSTTTPQTDDADGSIELPDYGSPLLKTVVSVAECPADKMEYDPNCNRAVYSYVVNGYFVWGLNEVNVESPAGTVYLAERRSSTSFGVPPLCDVIFHPWWNPTDSLAPRNDMDPNIGAITSRHSGGGNYGFSDSHCQWKKFSSTWNPPLVDFYTP